MIVYRFGKSPTFALAVALLLLAFSSGCSEKDTGRVAVWGDVTWKGQPVPSGVVYFSPDTKKGNKGPQGYALIKAGAYDSRGELSKGCVTGPVMVSIQGCDGQGIVPGKPYGRSLFASHETSLDIPAEGGQIDLTVPDSAAPPAAASEKE